MNIEPLRKICRNCGSNWNDERLILERQKNPELISCCPERKMVDVYEHPQRQLSVESVQDAFIDAQSSYIERLKNEVDRLKEDAKKSHTTSVRFNAPASFKPGDELSVTYKFVHEYPFDKYSPEDLIEVVRGFIGSEPIVSAMQEFIDEQK